jgi:nucleoside-specific outer membrane channel protein Tsx
MFFEASGDRVPRELLPNGEKLVKFWAAGGRCHATDIGFGPLQTARMTQMSHGATSDTAARKRGMSIATVCLRDRRFWTAAEGAFSNRKGAAFGLDGAVRAGVEPIGGRGVNENKGQTMKLRHLIFAAAMVVTTSRAWAQGFSDTWIGLRDGPTVSNPGAEKGGRNVNKIIASVGHFDVWDYGTNFFNADVLFSNANEPANASAGGSTEFYGVYRAQLSPDKIFGLNTKFGPITGINFEIGGDAEAENTAFAPDKKLLVVGPNINFDLGKGFLNIGIHFSKEWNNNGFSDCPSHCFTKGGPVSFDPAAEFEFVWLYNLTSITGLPLDFKGFMNVVMPKGRDGFGGKTVTEVLAVPALSLDIGALAMNKPHKLNLVLSLELWENKFGNNHTKVAGCEEVSPMLGLQYHF